MSRATTLRTTNLFQVVADMQESMEDSGLSRELVDIIVTRRLEILLGTMDDQGEALIG